MIEKKKRQKKYFNIYNIKKTKQNKKIINYFTSRL